MPTDDKMSIDERFKYLRIVHQRYAVANRKALPAAGRAESPTERHGGDYGPESEDTNSTDEWKSGAETASQATWPHLWRGR